MTGGNTNHKFKKMNTTLPGKPPMLTCVVGTDNVIYLTIDGDLISTNHVEFEEWAAKVRQAMVDVSTMNPARVLTLIAVSPETTFDLEISKLLRELMEFNRSYATKTAVYGMGPIIEAIVHSIIVLTRRYNMKIFATREAAFSWLMSDDDERDAIEDK